MSVANGHISRLVAERICHNELRRLVCLQDSFDVKANVELHQLHFDMTQSGELPDALDIQLRLADDMQPECVLHRCEHERLADPLEVEANCRLDRLVLYSVVIRIIQAVWVRVQSVLNPRRREWLANTGGAAATRTLLAHRPSVG